MQGRVETGRHLSLRVAIGLAPIDGAVSASLKPFDIPREGVDVTVIVLCPGLMPDGDMQQVIRVLPDEHSEPHLFSFVAGPIGLHDVTVEAYRGGTYLGAVRLQVSVERSVEPTPKPAVRMATLAVAAPEAGEITLQVSKDGPPGGDGRQAYRFQLLGNDALYPVVTEAMMGPADAAVALLIEELNSMAAKRSRYVNRNWCGRA